MLPGTILGIGELTIQGIDFACPNDLNRLLTVFLYGLLIRSFVRLLCCMLTGRL
ncbi:MAG: hypothetical protein KDK23_11205 [Leptospiraceae bacterium]|nr:hypothetical protein [Leptospiraceae bacterium]